ncbi:aconitate hydratase AcnA [Candidatus Jidaibacter acanthamoebae]|nr:aconitate hydratase AcnA [Candidatus Jidaibacter acanthamoeba]
MKFGDKNSTGAKSKLKIGSKEYTYFNLNKAAQSLNIDAKRLPISMKIILENLLRFEDNRVVKRKDLEAVAEWLKTKKSDHEIAFLPARVLMQDFTGVPAVVDLAAMRDAINKLGGDANKVNPLIPVDLVIDHSVQVDKYATPDSLKVNVKYEMERNLERYEFLRWGQDAFNNFRVVPPGTGICHQVNLEYLAQVVWTMSMRGETFAYPDTLVGTDSHTTMINGLSVLGWGVGGIEAEAAMLGQPISMLLPEVIGFKMTGNLREGVTATDLVLTVTNMLRKKGVVGKFVEFYGEGLKHLPLADRSTIANMAPEYGATCGFFPIDEETVKYLELSARPKEVIDLVETYAKEQGLWRDDSMSMEFTDTLELNLSEVEPSLAGPKRPQDKINLSAIPQNFQKELPSLNKDSSNTDKEFHVQGKSFTLGNGNVVIAAITSCTNTSNPSVMIGAGLLAKKAIEKGLNVKPWVKTSLAPGSKVVSEYLSKSGLQYYLDELGFYLVGYGCTTCIGNSGPLLEEIEKTIVDNNLVVAAVLSGNRNFEGRVHPYVRANYLASPPLCVAYAIAGTMEINLSSEPIGKDKHGNNVFLKDIWPSNEEIREVMSSVITPQMFASKYAEVFEGEEEWKQITISTGLNYTWNDKSTYIKQPPYFENMSINPSGTDDISNARILALLSDSITTDHISPAGNIAKTSPAAKYLLSHNIPVDEFNSYGSRRGNHEVMMRGTFANTRIKNEMAGGAEGGLTRYMDEGEVESIYDAAMKYREENIPLVIFAGKEYGTGSSRDWAAKGTNLLGVKAVIAESFERIHRSNLVGMGVMPLVFQNGLTWKDLKLSGKETVSITGLENITPLKPVKCTISLDGMIINEITLTLRVDTEVEVEYVNNGGILQYVLRKLV